MNNKTLSAFALCGATLILSSCSDSGNDDDSLGSEPFLYKRENTYTLKDVTEDSFTMVENYYNCKEGKLVPGTEENKVGYSFDGNKLSLDDWPYGVYIGGTAEKLTGKWNRDSVEEGGYGDYIEYSLTFKGSPIPTSMTRTRIQNLCFATVHENDLEEYHDTKIKTDGCNKLTATNSDGESASIEVLTYSPPTRITMKISYNGKSCTIADESFELTASLCKQTWDAYQADGSNDYFYWNEWVPYEKKDKACLEDLKIPNDLNVISWR